MPSGAVVGGEVSQVAVLVGRHEGQRSREAPTLRQRTGDEAIKAVAIAVAEPRAAQVGLPFHGIGRALGLHQNQAGLAVGPVERTLRPAQHFDGLHLVENRIAELLERNSVDVDRSAVDQEGVGFDSANGDVHIAQLPHRVELYIGSQLVQVTKLDDARFLEVFAV